MFLLVETRVFMNSIKELSVLLNNIDSSEEVANFFKELLTESELETLSKRWRILTMLRDGYTQREIAKELQVSLCNITRGSKVIKDKDSVLLKYLTKEN